MKAGQEKSSRSVLSVVLALAVVLLLGFALAVASRAGSAPSEDERVAELSSQVRCPTCRGLSAQESSAPAAAAVRNEIGRLVDEGKSDDEVLSYFVARYGDSALMEPPSDGAGLYVWALPLAVLAVGITVLVGALSRWRRPGQVASIDDLDLVRKELDL